MVKKKKTGTLIILSGPSGAGKGTICEQLLKEIPIDLSISMTTRSPRGNEVDGKDYFFVTRSFFEENIEKGNFLEYAKVHGDNYYGTPIIATVSHFTRNGKVALYRKRPFGNSKIIVRYYRRPESVIKIKDGNNK